MTTAAQKKSELDTLRLYLKSIGIRGSVKSGERPDFLVSTMGQVIGVEITDYHQIKNEGQKYSRTQVEAEFLNLRKSVVKYRDENVGLEKLSVQLDFKELSVPRAKDHRPFIRAVHQEIDEIRSDLTEGSRSIVVNKSSSEILQKYISKIHVRIVRCYMEWDSNLSFTRIGTREEEILECVRSKLSFERKEGIDELHLVLAGDGVSGATCIGYLHVDILSLWSKLNVSLANSYFSKFGITTYNGLFLWEEAEGWLYHPFE